MKEEITSRQNPRIQELAKLKRKERRLATHRFLVEGIRGVEEAVDAGASVYEVLVAPRLLQSSRGRSLCQRLVSRGLEVIKVTEQVIAAVCETDTPQGVVAAVGMPEAEIRLEGNPLVIVTDGISDPGNLGTLVRSAAAFGLSGAILTGGTVDVYSPKCVRATMGSLFRVPVRVMESAAEAVSSLARRGIAVVAADARAMTPCDAHDFARPSGILLGNEARGCSPEAMALCGARVRIPMPGWAESLNVAAAGAVLMYEATRQRTVRTVGRGNQRKAAPGEGCCGAARRYDIMRPQESNRNS